VLLDFLRRGLALDVDVLVIAVAVKGVFVHADDDVPDGERATEV
jgi:hypothetical protein